VTESDFDIYGGEAENRARKIVRTLRRIGLNN
jgi:hypothetical protein